VLGINRDFHALRNNLQIQVIGADDDFFFQFISNFLGSLCQLKCPLSNGILIRLEIQHAVPARHQIDLRQLLGLKTLIMATIIFTWFL